MKRTMQLLAFVLIGCGAQSAHESGDVTSGKLAAPETLVAVDSASDLPRQESQGAAGRNASPLQRKIVYTGDVELVVERFSEFPARVEELVRLHGGYVAGSNLGGSAGDPRSGTWKLRIPVERFDAFLNAVRKLGNVRRIATNSQDVSEEYYDVEARVRNRHRQEEQLLKLLEERTGELEQVLAVERELSRVREEIERLEGRLRVLQDLTALTTINLTVDEIRNYVPAEAASLGTRIRRTFVGSLDALRTTGERLLIVCVALVPWLAVILPPVLLLAILIRRGLRRRHAPARV